MSIIDLFREFSAVATSDNYSGSSRILYYTLLYIWNERRRPSEVSVAQKQLCALTGLPPATFADAVQYLTSRHWIKRLKSRNRTIFVYKLNEFRTNAERAAGFLMSPAQSKSKMRLEESPNGDSSTPNKDSEENAHVRKNSFANNAGNSPETRGKPSEISIQSGANESVPDEHFAAEVPDLKR